MTTTKPCPALQSRIAAFAGRVNKLSTKVPPRRPRFATDADVELRELYSPLDVPHAAAPATEGPTDRAATRDYLSELGLPGEFPFTRGVQPTMYRGRLWTMRQYAGFGTAEDSNQRYRYLLERGQTGLSVAFDLPTQMGRDPDHELSRGEVGRVGVSIATLADMRILLGGLPLDKITTSMTINSTAATLLALYVAVADERGVPQAQALGGTVQNDILKEYIARGTYIYPPRPSLRLITDLFAFCHAELPQWNTISISGYHIREAGSDAIQEVAFTLADGIAYVEAALQHRAARRRLCASAVVLLQRPQQPHRGGRQVPCRPSPVGPHHARALRRQGRQELHAAVSCADGGLDADGAAAAV
jgi:methylmalonyl-CoA mutase N-terminal domain/subunit